MPHRAAVVTVGLAMLAAPLAALSQAEQQTSNPQEPPVVSRTIFRSGVEYVPLDVVVTDDRGHAVTDLTADDFTITEDGRKQTLRTFEHIAIPPRRRVVDLRAAAAPPPDVATNVAPDPASRAFVFVIDDGTVRPETVVPLKRAMTEFLAMLSPVDRVAIVFVKRSDLSVDFTSDLGRLARGVGNVDKIVGSGGPDARATRLVLVNVVTSLAAAPETRRTLVLLSSGNPISPAAPGLDVMPGPSRLFTMHGLQDLFDRARNADVIIDAVDPSGLLTLDTGLATGGHPSTTIHGVATQDFMRTLPYNTGGLAEVNVNDMPAAADAVVQDNSDYYVLGYSPTPFVADHKFHEAEVTVTTRPGLHVRARKGYVAEAASASSSAGVAAALGDAHPRSDLGLRVFLAPVAPKANGTTSILTIDVDYPAMADGSVRSDDDLNVAFLALDPDGQVMKSEPQAFQVALSAAPSKSVTVSLDDVLDLPKGKWMLRVAVASKQLGTTGTVHLPVDIPAFSAKTLETSPLVIGLPTVTALVGRPESIASLVPLQPVTERTFAVGTRLRVFARAFSAKPAEVRADLRLTQDAKVVRTAPVHLRSLAGTPAATDCEAVMPLTDLVAGDYVLEMTVRGSDNHVQSQSVAIKVK